MQSVNELNNVGYAYTTGNWAKELQLVTAATEFTVSEIHSTSIIKLMTMCNYVYCCNFIYV